MLQFWQTLLSHQGKYSGHKLLHFGSPQQERNALQSQPCIVPFTALGLLQFKGADAKKFLQGQVTCNLDDISEDKSSLAAHCNLKGRMHSLFRLFQTHVANETVYYLELPSEMLAQVHLNFKKYALFSKVTIAPQQDLAGFGLYGCDVDQLLTIKPPLQTYQVVTQQQNQGFYSVCRLPGKFNRFSIWGTLDEIKALWLTYLEHCKPILPEAWELLDIQAGVPAIYLKTTEQVLPHHANLSILNGISYTKGCYLGQEIIARMQYKGKIKKHMVRGLIQDVKEKPEPGALVYSADFSEEPGLVLRAAENETGAVEILVILSDQIKNFDTTTLYSADGPKIHRLDLPYSLSQ